MTFLLAHCLWNAQQECAGPASAATAAPACSNSNGAGFVTKRQALACCVSGCGNCCCPWQMICQIVQFRTELVPPPPLAEKFPACCHRQTLSTVFQNRGAQLLLPGPSQRAMQCSACTCSAVLIPPGDCLWVPASTLSCLCGSNGWPYDSYTSSIAARKIGRSEGPGPCGV